MLKQFQKYSFSSIYISIFFLILLWLNSFLNFNTSFQETEVIHSPLFNIIYNKIANLTLLKTFFAFVLFAIQVLIIISISFKHNIFDKKTFIGGFILTILSGFFYIQKLTGVLVANVFVLIALSTFLKINTQKKSIVDIFNTGLLLSISSLFYLPYIFFLIFGIIAIIIIRSKLTKEIIVFIVAFFVIYVLFLEIIKLTKTSLNLNEIYSFYFAPNIYNIHWKKTLFFGFPVLVFLTSNIHILSKINTKEIEKRTIFQLFFVFFIFILFLGLIINQPRFELISSAFIPVSILFGDYFTNVKPNKRSRLFFNLFVLNSVFYQIIIFYFLK